MKNTTKHKKRRVKGVKEATSSASSGAYQTPLNVGQPVRRKKKVNAMNEEIILITEKEYMSLLKKVMLNEFVYNSKAGKNTSVSRKPDNREALNNISVPKNTFKPNKGNGDLTDDQRTEGYQGGMHDYEYDYMPKKAKDVNLKAFKQGGESAEKLLGDAKKRAETRFKAKDGLGLYGSDVELNPNATPKRKESVAESKLIKEAHYKKDNKFKSLTKEKFDMLIKFLSAERSEKNITHFAKKLSVTKEWLSLYYYEYAKKPEEIKKLKDFFAKHHKTKGKTKMKNENHYNVLPYNQVLTEETLNTYLNENADRLTGKEFIVRDNFGDRVYVNWGKVINIKPLKNMVKENEQKQLMQKLFESQNNENKNNYATKGEAEFFNNFLKRMTNENN